MNQLSERDLQQHVTIVGWLMIGANVLFLAIGALVCVLLLGIGAVSGDRQALGVLAIVGISVGAFLAILGIPGILAGIGLLRRRTWGRILAIIVAVLGLVNVPLGTLLGIYALWVLLQESATSYFSGGQPS